MYQDPNSNDDFNDMFVGENWFSGVLSSFRQIKIPLLRLAEASQIFGKYGGKIMLVTII